MQAADLLPSRYQHEVATRPVFGRRLAALAEFDLSDISANLIDKGPQYSPEQVWPLRLHFGVVDLALARSLELEFRRFMALALLRPENVYAPPGPVDMYWHFFVLHTREYARFCDAIWRGSPMTSPEERPKYHGALAGSRTQGPSCVPPDIFRNVQPAVRDRLRALDTYDLSYFTDELIDRGRLFAPEQKYPIIAHFGKADHEVAVELEHEFRRFVALTLLEPDVVFAPSGPVDMYWHFLILHTTDYRDFCNTVWGSFQHHPRGSNHEAATSDR